MATITSLTCEDTGLDPACADIRTLEIGDAPLGSGGFGAVYDCRTCNGRPPATPLAVKILADDGTGSDARGYATVGALQERVRAANEGRRLRGAPPLQQVPGLRALPLFRFTGQVGGKDVRGYGAYRLDTQGYVPFEPIADGSDPAARLAYLQQPYDARANLAAALAEAFAVLIDELDYVHGDLNAPNLWVDPAAGRIAAIDFDGGAVLSGPNAQATTAGKLGDFLSPEASEHLAQGGAGDAVPVNRHTDAWAVMVGVSYLLFLCHPLLFLEQLGADTLRAYLAAYRWPDVDPGAPGFSRENAAAYEWYLEQVAQLPQPVRRAFETTLQEGSFAPGRRTAPAQWRDALRGAASLPVIHLFEADPPSVVAGTAVELRWWVEGALSVTIDPGAVAVPAMQSRLVFPAGDTTYTLAAHSLFGSVTATCGVRVSPRTPTRGFAAGASPPHAGGRAPAAGHVPPLRLKIPALRLGLRIDLSDPARPGPSHGTRCLTLNLPSFPWRSLFERISAITLHLR